MSKIIEEVSQHYEMWNQDNEKRLTRKNGWNDVTDAYWGKLPNDWPYDTRIVDPRIRTTIIEKNGRLINNKLRGRLVGREGSDDLKAMINNALLDYQWETANYGGTMHTKIAISDMDSRLYASKFAYVYWRYDVDEDGKVLFDGNEMMPLDIRDCGIDPSASHIRDAKWFQLRQWEKLEDLENAKDTNGKPMYKNLDKLKVKIGEKLNGRSSTRRSNEWVSRVKQLKGLEDRVGEDMAYPVVKTCTEFREDKWIKFVPDHNIILQEIKNPYIHRRIPISQLRYYPLQDDPLGESEVEPVLPIWLAIQASICSYMDEAILKMRPPLKIIANQVQIETIVYGPEAQWLVNSQDAIQEMQSTGDSQRYFQTSYQTLVSAFNVAMGDLSSQNVSSVDPFSNEPKTATEIKATSKQQNMRDQRNQNDLAEFIKDIMLMWLSNNKQFLFSDPDKIEYVLKIIGNDKYEVLKRAGLGDYEVLPEGMETIQGIIQQNPNISDVQIAEMMDAVSIPKYPIILNPKENDPNKIQMKPKLTEGEFGESVDVSIIPEDLEGTYDYVPDVKSMAAGSNEDLMRGRQEAITLLTTNANVLQLLTQEGFRPNVKELVRSTLEDLGLRDAERFFTKIEDEQLTGQNPTAQAGAPTPGGATPPMPNQGVQGLPQTNTPVGIQ